MIEEKSQNCIVGFEKYIAYISFNFFILLAPFFFVRNKIKD